MYNISSWGHLDKKNWRSITYDYEAMIENATGLSCLVCLTDFELAWLQANVEYMAWSTRWDNCPCTPDELAQMAAELERKLMTCADINPYQIDYMYRQQSAQQLEGFEESYNLGGIPELNPDTPTDFYSGDGSADRVNALCTATKVYVYSYAQNWVGVAQMTLGLVFVVGLLASISLVGGLIATVLVGGLTFISFTAIEAMQDEDALDDVVCCMFEALDGADITQANFETSLDACGFTVGSNQAIIRDIIASDLDQFKNWLSFINNVGDSYILAQAGVVDCPCELGWIYDSDWNVSEQGWTIFAGDPPFDDPNGSWSVGTGYSSADYEQFAGFFARSISVVYNMPATQVDTITMNFDFTQGAVTNTALTAVAIVCQKSDLSVVSETRTFAAQSDGIGLDLTFPVDEELISIRLIVRCSTAVTLLGLSGVAKLNSVHVEGEGINPFP